jgi:hypothetical protein
VKYKNQSIRHDIFLINKESSTEVLSPIRQLSPLGMEGVNE